MSSKNTCPAEGCEYTGTREAVCGHYGGKSDDKHAGGYQTAKEMIENASENPPASGSENTGNPVMGDADPNAGGVEDEPDEGDEDAEPVCPDCGAELVDYRQYENGKYHEIAGTNHYVRGDYCCSECLGWFVDE